ncbi:hypothetical protein [Paraglaciecola arctica]|uniref:hypothetical protein n=1 Tax=Paraglaciecola arctica TaxID=1128911 RepID=UPI001C07B1CB|nr:hypothetical protein [Paraglaciecola arctica]MBU3006007.1 hypothetical protein [Paraglaciecola arctica]
MKESDWKKFKQIKELALEKYCSSVLSECKEVVLNEQQHSHERYLYLYNMLQNRNEHMALMFDGHSRSKAWLQLIALRREGLTDEALVEELSEEFREKTDPTKLW